MTRVSAARHNLTLQSSQPRILLDWTFISAHHEID
jgi:hypothetical protein